jgi:hypothetical protein
VSETLASWPACLPLSSSGALTLQALVGQNGLTDAVVDVVGFFQ